MDFDENEAACLLLDTLSAEIIKSAKIKIRKNRFFFKFCLSAHVESKKVEKFIFVGMIFI